MIGIIISPRVSVPLPEKDNGFGRRAITDSWLPGLLT